MRADARDKIDGQYPGFGTKIDYPALDTELPEEAVRRKIRGGQRGEDRGAACC
jgi:hypothetical protein